MALAISRADTICYFAQEVRDRGNESCESLIAVNARTYVRARCFDKPQIGYAAENDYSLRLSQLSGYRGCRWTRGALSPVK